MTIEAPFTIDQEVYDDLTQKVCKVVGLSYEIGRTDPEHPNVSSAGCWGVWIDSPWLSGGRHPWEVSVLSDELRAQISAASQQAPQSTTENEGNTSPGAGEAL